MLHNIEPHVFNADFTIRKPADNDYILFFNENKIGMYQTGDNFILPKFDILNSKQSNLCKTAAYLFSIDSTGFYLGFTNQNNTPELFFKDIAGLREFRPQWLSFAVATAWHLSHWYEHNRFCGKCAAPMQHSIEERALYCIRCGTIIYPRISPVIIVGVTDGDKLLMTRYAKGPYRKLALVAGYMEIGETLEECVEREVMEEVGLNIKNIRYYKSQPWPFSQSLLAGFFAELDGSPNVTLDTRELSEAVWTSRNKIEVHDPSISLTNNMIEAFRNSKV